MYVFQPVLCVLLRTAFELFIHNSCNERQHYYVTIQTRIDVHTSGIRTYSNSTYKPVTMQSHMCHLMCKGTYLPYSTFPSHLPHPLQRKCERYWSTALNDPFKPGRDLSVTILRCDTHPEFELRTIKVEKVGTH